MLLLIGGIPLGFRSFHDFSNMEAQYHYTFTPQIHYTMGVRSHELYTAEVLGEDQYYLAQFVDKIFPVFSFELKGSQPAQIKGNYQILSEVRGYTEKEGNHEVIWQKQEVLLPEVQFALETDTINKEHSFTIDLQKYKAFVTNIEEEAHVKIDTEVVLTLKGELTILYKGQLVRIPIESTLSLPLNQNYFTLTKQGLTTTTDELYSNTPWYEGKILWLILLEIGVALLGSGCILFLIKGTRPMTAKEQKRKVIRKIFRLYGSQMVAVSHLPDYEEEACYILGSLEDLLKVAQTLEQPIFYMRTSNWLKIDKLYIVNQEQVYCYFISDKL